MIRRMGELESLVTPGRAAVLTMEVQRGVVGDLASIRVLADRVAEVGLVPKTAALLAGARRHGVPVVHCRAAFRSDRAGSFRNVPMVNRLLENPDHLVLGSPEADVVPEFGPEEGDLDSVRLHGMSPFFGTNLDPTLRSLGVSTVIATGVSLNVGVLGLVIEAINRGYSVVVPTDCVTGYPADYAAAVLEHSLARITTQTTSEKILATWG
jgi:nicotinamidase-related amidase